MDGLGLNKKVGDWVWLEDVGAYQILSLPSIFKSNRLATKEEINEYKSNNNIT